MRPFRVSPKEPINADIDDRLVASAILLGSVGDSESRCCPLDEPRSGCAHLSKNARILKDNQSFRDCYELYVLLAFAASQQAD